jgi:hypothetical protein
MRYIKGTSCGEKRGRWEALLMMDRGKAEESYQLSFCVSFAICSSTPSFSGQMLEPSSSSNTMQSLCDGLRRHSAGAEVLITDIPRSLMFMIPVALELVRFFAGTCFPSLGEEDTPLTAESILEISCASAAIVGMCECERGKVR